MRRVQHAMSQMPTFQHLRVDRRPVRHRTAPLGLRRPQHVRRVLRVPVRVQQPGGVLEHARPYGRFDAIRADEQVALGARAVCEGHGDRGGRGGGGGRGTSGVFEGVGGNAFRGVRADVRVRSEVVEEDGLKVGSVETNETSWDVSCTWRV